jgi:Flp pilus assembly pilin Flp
MLKRLLADDTGADLVEYGLLCALIAIIGFVAWQQIVTSIGVFYGWSDAGLQDLSRCTPDPGGGGC